MTFTLGFSPALNKNGYSKIRFVGAEHKSGTTYKKDESGNKIFDAETGSYEMIEWNLINFSFEAMGVVRGQWQKINIGCSQKYSEDNLLGKLLNQMGFIPSSLDCKEDDDGFQIIELEEDEEGFSEMSNSIVEEITDFIENNVGRDYIAKLYKASEGKNKGFWQIDVQSIEPYNKSNGKK